MNNFICATCGVQFEASESEPRNCPVCEDERQYVGWEGQRWTSLQKLRNNYQNKFTGMEEGITQIITEPSFGIGQRAFLIQTGAGNILWDCLTLIDDDTIAKINSLGGLKAIALSHPHYYSSIVEWSKAFGDIPVYINKADEKWLMRKNESVKLWEGDRHQINDELTIIKCGGHFDGASVLHWERGDDNCVLFSGDTIQIVMDRKNVSFMYSYPNLIPLSAEKVDEIVNRVKPFKFDKIYGAFRGRHILENARSAVIESAERYKRAIASYKK